MDYRLLIELASLALLLVASGLFSSAETIFFSLNPLQLRRITERHPAAGARLHQMVNNPTRLLSTILIGNTIVNVATAAVGLAIANALFQGRGELVAIPAVTILLILFGEIVPKRVGLYYAEIFSVLYAPIFSFLTRVFTPVRYLLDRITSVFEPLLRPHGKSLSSEEFETVLEIGNEAGAINADELAMLKAIVQLEDLSAADVMTPRVDIIGIDLEDPDRTPADTLALARKVRRNHIVLYRDTLDQITGFLDVRRYLLDPEHRIESSTRRPLFVPDSVPLNRLLTQFQKEHRTIAIAVDEYGGTAGVITRGDILEEITGEIYQELNKPRPLFQIAGPNRWLVDANFSLEELNRKLDLDLDSEGGDRLAGWIAEHAGHLPQKDDTVEAQGVRVTVLQTIRLRVTLAMIEKITPPDELAAAVASAAEQGGVT
jgi:putative hemolysin